MEQYYKLGFFPTPLEELKNLSGILNPYRIFIKRDDQTGLATGGNKTRKLEYLLQDAINQSCDTIITAGAQQSNHCRQTAAAAAKAGLKCHLVLGGNEPKEYNGNLLLSKILGANIHYCGDNRKGEDSFVIAESLKKEGFKPYIIPYGGSNYIGALGYVRAVKELQQQLKEENLTIDYIYFASSSGGTHAGMILGKELYQLNAEFLGIRIDKSKIYDMTVDENILKIIKEGKINLKLKKEFTTADIKMIGGYDDAGYGVVTDHERDAINLMAKNEGILLDPVYTGRAFYGMLDQLEKQQIKPGSNVLFWHTGGIPATFGYAKDLID